jgi:uncharacterized membrane protein
MNMTAGDKNTILSICRSAGLSPDTTAEVLLKSGIWPDKAAWERFSRRALLLAGAGFLLAGIIFFFAYNWAALGKFVKLGIILLLVIAALPFSFRPTLGGKLSLTAASVLTGVFLGVYGQIYQTGADSFTLFAAWALLILPWTLMSNFRPLWFIHALLILTAEYLFLDLRSGGSDMSVASVSILGLTLAALFFLHLLLGRRGYFGAPAKWNERILLTLSLSLLTFTVLGYIFGRPGDYPDFFPYASPLLYLSVMAVFFLAERSLRHDTFIYAAMLISFNAVLTSLFIEVMDFNFSDFGPWLATGLFIILLGSLLVFLIQTINGARGEAEKNG